MPNITAKQQTLIACALALLMVATRSPQIPGFELIPGASWAVFFAAGVYLSATLALPAFMGLAFVVDAAAIGWGGISAYCLTPAYAMLAPAYAALWVAGRWYAAQHRMAWSTMPPLAVSVLVGALLCEGFSSGGFYWMSGVFTDPSLAEFAARETRYFPAYLATMGFWIALIALVHGGMEAASARLRGARSAAA